MSTLPDIQNKLDNRGIALDRVGITNIVFPIRVSRRDLDSVEVPAVVHLFVGLPKEAKGANMSRFMECLVEFSHKEIDYETMPALLSLLKTKLGSVDSYARFEFDYFIDKKAPVTDNIAPQSYHCAFSGIKRNGGFEFILEVNVIAAAVCPCSKEMSLLENLTSDEISCDNVLHIDFENFRKEKFQIGAGAHNQRSKIRVQAALKELVWIEDLVELIEREASAPTYPILKRPDEKFVTERGYRNAKFTEDIARDIQIALEKDSRITKWKIKVENEESIHPHNACVYHSSDNWK